MFVRPAVRTDFVYWLYFFVDVINIVVFIVDIFQMSLCEILPLLIPFRT